VAVACSLPKFFGVGADKFGGKEHFLAGGAFLGGLLHTEMVSAQEL